ncbi:MAG TPA: hypothetical protein VMU81_04505 [Acetobacteraceae bacterium]|jgi:hypothetical protein|nr:hypothetical protein [Acetobacteraceae bacterium]
MHATTQSTILADVIRGGVEQLGRTLLIARSLVRAGKQVDLTGLDAEMGSLCAQMLDLPREQGRAARPVLMALRSELEALIDTMEMSGPQGSGRSSPRAPGHEIGQ